MRHHLNPDFRKQPKTGVFCCVCGRDLKKPAGEVFLGEGCFDAITHDEADYDGLRGLIGPECVKIIPEQFLICKSIDE